METPLSGRAARRLVCPACGATGARPDREARSAHSRRDPGETDGRLDALEHAAPGEETGAEPYAGRPRVAKAWHSAAPHGAVYGVGRSRVRAKSGGCVG